MKWLKKLGTIILKAQEFWTGFAPMAQMMLPGQAAAIQVVSTDLAQVADVVVQTEIFGAALGIAGPDKLKAAAPAVAQIIMKSAILAKHDIEDPVLFMAGCTKIADGMADCLNSFKDKIETVSKA